MIQPDADPPFVPERPLTRKALDWARELHGGQLRDVDHAPFILHPLEVAALLSGRGVDDEVVAAGLLHDAVEDTDAGVAEIRGYMGDRVADIVAALTEDPTISGFPERKAKLRSAVAAAGADEHAVYAADKVVKARELRAQAARAERSLDDPDLRERLAHYQESLAMLQRVAPDLALVHQLAFELWRSTYCRQTPNPTGSDSATRSALIRADRVAPVRSRAGVRAACRTCPSRR